MFHTICSVHQGREFKFPPRPVQRLGDNPSCGPGGCAASAEVRGPP